MKVVIDTSVLVSAVLQDKAPERVIVFVVEHPDFEWVVSREILEESRDILARPKFGPPADLLRRWYPLHVRKDAKFLACAVSAAADYFITGDRDFEHAEKLMKTTILSVSSRRQRLDLSFLTDRLTGARAYGRFAGHFVSSESQT